MADAIGQLAEPWGYVLVFLLTALETSAFIGLFVPGETALLVAGFVAASGRASLATMIVVAVAGAVAGDAVGFQVGRRLGPRLRHSGMGRRMGEERWEKADAYLRRKGGRAVLLGRFIGVLRALVPAMAGMARMPYRRFLPWDLVGGALWATLCVLIGFLAGGSYQRAERVAGRAGLVLLGVALVIGGAAAGARWVSRHPERVRAFAERLLGRPAVARLLAAHRRVVATVISRLRPGQAFGLSLTAGLVSLVLLGWLFGTLVGDILGDQDVLRVDEPLNSYLATHREEWLTSVMTATSGLANSAVLVPVVVGVGVMCSWRSRRTAPVVLAVTAWGGAAVLAAAVKALVTRPRPPLALAVGMSDTLAFPSAPTTEITAVAGIVVYLVTRPGSSWPVVVTRWSSAIVIALVVGFSHAYLGVQWLTDVVAGWMLGAMWLSVLLATVPIVARARTSAASPEGADLSST